MSDTTHGPHVPERPFGSPVWSSPLLETKDEAEARHLGHRFGLESAKATVAAFNRPHPVNECGPSCETGGAIPPYVDPRPLGSTIAGQAGQLDPTAKAWKNPAAPLQDPLMTPWRLRDIYREKARQLEREREALRDQLRDIDNRLPILHQMIDLLR